MRTWQLSAIALAVLTSSAQAEFYIVQDNTTRTCSIVQQRPAGTGMTVVGGENRSYQSRDAAEIGMQAEPVCRQGTTGAGSGAAPASPGRPGQ